MKAISHTTGKNEPRVNVTRLIEGGDRRGASYSLPAAVSALAFSVRDLHVTTLCAGAVRGNHYHALKAELLIVVHHSRWSLYWDSGPTTAVHQRLIEGSGCALVEIPANCSHAIKNDGEEDLIIVGLSDHDHDPLRPDTMRRQVVSQ